MAELYIGTSGWSYRHWRECFYQKTAQTDWLKFYAERFNAVEINGTFYRLQRASTFEKWHEETPAAFMFALKANRYLTHHKKLKDPENSVLIEKQHAESLNGKLSAVLWQLSRQFKKDLPRLEGFIEALREWPETRHVIEFRHASWFADDTADRLTRAGIAVCQSDAGDWPLWYRVTTDLVYIRLHGRPQTYASSYSETELTHWADKIEEWRHQCKSVHVYFDNDAGCAAPFNAQFLKNLTLNR